MRRVIERPAAACGRVIARGPAPAPYHRCLPHIAGPRPDWAIKALWQHFFTPAVPPQSDAVLLADATVLGPGIVLSGADTLIAESLLNCADLVRAAHLRRTDPGAAWYAETAPPIPYLAGTHLLLRQMWDHNYGHWLVETLSRLGVLGTRLPGSYQVLVSDHGGQGTAMHRVQTESLGLFGIGPDRIRRIGWDPIQVERLIFVTPLTRQPWLKSPLVIETLARLSVAVPSGPTDPPGRLYLRRPANGRRQLRNEAALLAQMTAHGFVPITHAALGFCEQVAQFRATTHLVATLGAECTNLAFALPGCTLLGLAPPGMQDDFFYDLVSLKGGRYFCLHGKSDSDDMNADFSPDPAQFASMLAASLE